MKKVLVVLFLLLGAITYTKPYYSNGKEEKIQTVYNVVGLTRPKMENPVAQEVMDDFTRLVYDAQVDSMLTSKEDFAKLNKYYDKRANTVLDKFVKNKDSFSDNDMDQIMSGLTYLKGKLQEYTSAWVKK